MKPLTQEEFIERATLLHNARYDYSQVVYANRRSKITIVCPLHGAFTQLAGDHLYGRGCRPCGRLAIDDSKRKPLEQFIAEVNEVHKGKYDYSKVEYCNQFTNVTIGCPTHGLFRQSPNNHLNGAGCPRCKKWKGETAIRSYLETNNIPFRQGMNVKLKDYWFRFDFVVRVQGKIAVIEYNGKQHYLPIAFGSGTSHAKYRNLMTNIRNDHRKYKKCNENGVRLVVIPYWDLDRIDEILDDFFNCSEPVFSDAPTVIADFAPQRQAIRERLRINKPDFLCGIYS